MRNFPRWTVVFKALSNINRLKILALLTSTRQMNVSDIAESLKISVTATSNHLIMMQKLDVLETEGKDGHVFYSLNSRMPQDFAKALKLFL
ncbi:MAG TPA: metalloregulator ArsR/SmtB family transcription factor [Candidatus Paceibacterota bacterium]